MKEQKIEYKLTKKQDQAFEYLTNDLNQDVLYGGAKGGGKSFLLCLWAYYWCKWLISFFDIKEPLKNPLPVGFIGRKRSADFTKTTLETFKKIIPPTSYEIKEHDKEIIIDSKVKILFGGLDDQININKFNSAELAFIGIDQGEETDRSDIAVLEASLRLKHDNKQPPYKKLYTANPAECWLKSDFVHHERKNAVYIPALPMDNPHLPTNYLETLEASFSYDPILLAAYKEGNWEQMVTESLVIPSGYLTNLKNAVYMPTKYKRYGSCDPSSGGDECVLMAFENRRIIDQKILHYKDIMKIAGEIVIMMEHHKLSLFGIDSIGDGKGVVKRLAEMGKKVLAINSAESANDKTRFFNRKTEMWWKAREFIIDKEVPYIEDEETRRQLSSVKYSIVNSSGKVQVEPKEKTKRRLGRSPDRGDCFIYGIWTGEQLSATTQDKKNPRGDMIIDKQMEALEITRSGY